MIAATEAQDAWCPPTFSPSRLGRMWLAWWIAQADSHSSLRWICSSWSRRDPASSLMPNPRDRRRIAVVALRLPSPLYSSWYSSIFAGS